MQEVAKAPMLKPPITKTNVLRMNHNFRGALALYEFISAYDKPGYTAEEKVSVQNPLRTDVADEMAEIVMITSFLTYEHGLNLKGELQVEYDKEEERRREEEKKKLLDQLKALRHRIREAGDNPEEYMLMLEKTNRMLQEDRERLFTAKQEIEQLKGDIATLEREKKLLNGEIARLGGDIEDMKKSHTAEINDINEKNEAEIKRQADEYDERLLTQKTNLEGKIAELGASAEEMEKRHLSEKEELAKQNAATLEETEAQHRAKLSELDEWVKSGKSAINK
jgi:chromosome segregation ATPase